MAQVVNTNIASINAQRNLASSGADNATALERLSSGLRINSAADDAAGLAISTRLDSQIRGSAVAIRNAGDGISLAQTADGALGSINDSLQRIRELAVQSANSTNTDLDRASLQAEVDQLIEEIGNVASTANFNGLSLFDGSLQNSTFQTGTNVGDTISVSIAQLDTNTLGAGAGAGISSNVQSAGITAAQTFAAGDIVVNGVAVAAPNATSDTASTAFAESSAISRADAINAVSEQTGVTATVGENRVEGTTIAAGNATAVAAEALTVNGVAVQVSLAAVETSVALGGVADSINSISDATGVTAEVVSTSTGFRIDLAAEDGRNITISSATSTTQTFGLGTAAANTATTFLGNITLSSTDGSDIDIASNTDDIDNFGFEVGTFSGSTAGVVGDNSSDANRAATVAGDVIINGVDVGATLAGDDTASTDGNSASAISLAAAINRVSDQTGVTATANENTVASGTIGTGGGNFDITINDTQITGATVTGAANLSTNQATIINAINAESGRTGVTAEALGADQFTLTAADGRNIEIATATAGDTALTTNTFIGGVALQSGGAIELGTQTGNIENAGLTVGSFGASETGTLLSDIDITTIEGANAAITAIDNAVNTVSSVRANLGAVQNRFEATISNLQITSENLSATNSSILDADFAAETAALSRSSVLQQAGISILAQANAAPNQILSLLG